MIRSNFSSASFPAIKEVVATSGNIGMPFTPLEIPLGKVCQFNVYHLLEIDDPVGQFPVRMQEVGR